METKERILDAIEVITTEMDYIYEAIKNIDNSVPAKSAAIAEVVREREQTNRELIDFCKQLLNDCSCDDDDIF